MKKIILSTLNLLNQKISLLVGRLEKKRGGAFEDRRKLNPFENINALISLGAKVLGPRTITDAKIFYKISPNDIKRMELTIPILDSKSQGTALYKTIRLPDIVIEKSHSNGDKSHDSLFIQQTSENIPAGIVENLIELRVYAGGSRYILEK